MQNIDNFEARKPLLIPNIDQTTCDHCIIIAKQLFGLYGRDKW